MNNAIVFTLGLLVGVLLCAAVIIPKTDSVQILEVPSE